MTCDRNEYLWGVPDDRPPNADAVAPPCAPPRRQADQRAPQRLRHVADSRRSYFSSRLAHPRPHPVSSRGSRPVVRKPPELRGHSCPFFLSLFALRSFPCRKIWPLPRSMSTSKKSSAPSSSVRFSLSPFRELMLSQGSRSSQRQSAPLPSTVSSSIQPRSRSVSSSLFSSRWPGQTP